MSSHSSAPTGAPAGKHPGNLLGAVGLFATLVGACTLVYDVPPESIAVPHWAAWPLAVAGLTLLVGGLLKEWRGPARTSALVPGIAALAMGSAVVGASIYPWITGPLMERVTAPVHMVVYHPRESEPSACVLVIGGRLEVGRLTAKNLASRGVAAAFASAEPFDSQATLNRTLGELSARSTGGRCTLMTHGTTPSGADLIRLAKDFERKDFERKDVERKDFERRDFERVVAVSFQAADHVTAPRNATPVLYVFGGGEPSGHANARALHSQLGAPDRDGLPESVVRIFLGADRDLLVPRARPWLEPGRLANGYVEMVARWARDGVTED